MPRFDFDESDQSAALHDEIDVSAPRAETALEDAPPCPLEPARCDTLAEDPKARSLLGHGTRIGSLAPAHVIFPTRGELLYCRARTPGRIGRRNVAPR